ncbi:MAG TPA: c-type cytochrome [Anaerolineae bacterium]|nr:c-type cytochrome [Anaerolineae bacterium]
MNLCRPKRGMIFCALVLFLTECATPSFIPGSSATPPVILPQGTAAQTNDVIEIFAHQWWWELNYPDQQVTTANEIHIPVGRPVELQFKAEDVTGIFWMSELNRIIGLFPKTTTTTVIEATQAGTFRGTCAEFCGVSPAQMSLLVIADPPDQFNAWLAQQRQIPPELTDETLRTGQQAFLGSACVYCHTVKGTNATGTLGPDLTHLMSRKTIGAGTLPNTRGNLAGWIVNAQDIKPGNKMPPMQLESDQLQALLAYLESLK